MTFGSTLAEAHGVPNNHLLVKYLERKTKAVDRGSKARRSLGNLYALLVLAEDFVDGRTSRFTDLLARMKALPFGSKLQNHPLDNRLNDEFSRQMGVSGDMLPVRAGLLNGQKARTLSPDLLGSGDLDPLVTASFVVETIRAYVDLITKNQASMLEEIEAISDLNELIKFAEVALAPNSDARLFEIVSYGVLAEFYRGKKVWIGSSKDNVQEEELALFRTGRTNANDGGIDFVLKPVGRFFQVTETMDFTKYFLDLEKVNRYPISFVVKVEDASEEALALIRADAERSGKYTTEQIDLYLSLFEELFTLPDLRGILETVGEDAVSRMKDALSLQFQLEYGLLD